MITGNSPSYLVRNPYSCCFRFATRRGYHCFDRNKHISLLSGMFRQAIKEDYISINPASDMKVPEPKGKKQTVDKFSQEDLNKIFSSSVLGINHLYQFCGNF